MTTPKFKVGDKIKATKEYEHLYPNPLYSVIAVDSEGDPAVRVINDGDDPYLDFEYAFRFELVEPGLIPANIIYVAVIEEDGGERIRIEPNQGEKEDYIHIKQGDDTIALSKPQILALINHLQTLL